MVGTPSPELSGPQTQGWQRSHRCPRLSPGVNEAGAPDHTQPSGLGDRVLGGWGSLVRAQTVQC